MTFSKKLDCGQNSKMMKESIEGGIPDCGQRSGHVSDGKYVYGKVNVYGDIVTGGE